MLEGCSSFIYNNNAFKKISLIWDFFSCFGMIDANTKETLFR